MFRRMALNITRIQGMILYVILMAKVQTHFWLLVNSTGTPVIV